MWRFPNSLQFWVIRLFILWTGLNATYGKELDQKILNIYLGSAFASTDQLVKFTHVPAASVYCNEGTCHPQAEKLTKILDGAVTVKPTDSENSGADIEILFYPNPTARLQSKNQYTAIAGEVLGKLVHENCAAMQSRRGFEVVKVTIVVTEDAGPKQNLVCIVNELVRGAGMTVEGRYPEYLKSYLEIDESRLETALRGIVLFLAMHVSPSTQPGQDRATVGDELKSNFITYN